MDTGELDPALDEAGHDGDRLLEVLLSSVPVVDQELERSSQVERLGLALGPGDALSERLLGERERMLVVAGRQRVKGENERRVGLRRRGRECGRRVCREVSK